MNTTPGLPQNKKGSGKQAKLRTFCSEPWLARGINCYCAIDFKYRGVSTTSWLDPIVLFVCFDLNGWSSQVYCRRSVAELFLSL